jgi:hypothetical protein
MTIYQDTYFQPHLDNTSNHFNTMPRTRHTSPTRQTNKANPLTLALKEKDDRRTQPWKAFMDVTHTADSPIVLGINIRLLGQRVNAHVG